MTTSATNAVAAAQQTHGAAAASAAATAMCNGSSGALLNQRQEAGSPTHPSVGGQQQQQTRAMQTDEDFNIRFVNLVRIHKCLYDKKVPEYRNRDNQEKSWSLISQECGETVIHCKERWRNLRACLSRYIKQQNSSDPQHKPYYLTEHMAFLLPFLKSTRNSVENGHGMPAIFQIQSQPPHGHLHPTISPNATIQVIQPSHLQYPIAASPDRIAMKHSLSEQEDEETIDAFDPAVTANLHHHQHHHQAGSTPNGGLQQANGGGSMHHLHHHPHHLLHPGNAHSPPLSDTASANTLQNFIPDCQLSEMQTPDPVSPAHGDLAYAGAASGPSTGNIGMHHMNGLRRDSCGPSESLSGSKRIKTECQSRGDCQTPNHMATAYENSDMEFFRSILPDVAMLTPQQKRKLKIGILELIDDVVDRYPAERLSGPMQHPTTTNGGRSQSGGAAARGNEPKQRRTMSREWRK